ATGKERFTLRGHRARVTGVALALDSRTLASGCDDKFVKVWNIITGTEVATLGPHKEAVKAVDFAPDGQTVASASNDLALKLWDLNTKKEKEPFKGSSVTKPVLALAFTPDGRSLLSASQDQTVRVWNLADGIEQLKLSSTQTGEFTCLACSPDGQRIA